MAFDWDGDEVLTIQEIKDGMRANNIRLMDDEWQKLVDAIDADCDGVLTCDEWLNVLEPKLDAQKKFTDIMKDIDINDPLDLEERILDL
jgi:Ca2+-binding EF-hand superfamily protein